MALESSKQEIKNYASEVTILNHLRHRNLIQLIGCYHEKKDLLVVYKFMENGSLDSHFFEAKSLLTRGVRYKIAQQLASALLYVHEEWEKCVLHRDIKLSNIMLDLDFNANLGDFGLARLVDHEKGLLTTMVAGTQGYMAPECYLTSKYRKKTDVYGFGVVALEIACGRRSIDNEAPERQTRIVQWVWELYGMRKLLEAADPRLGTDLDKLEIKRMMIVGLWCAHPDPYQRPSIKQAIQALNFNDPMPDLPSKMPVANYFSVFGGKENKEVATVSTSIYNTESSD